jgi:hypothetical protein
MLRMFRMLSPPEDLTRAFLLARARQAGIVTVKSVADQDGKVTTINGPGTASHCSSAKLAARKASFRTRW